jgi:hypothetical protein
VTPEELAMSLENTRRGDVLAADVRWAKSLGAVRRKSASLELRVHRAALFGLELHSQ